MATKDELVGLFDHVEEALDARGYFHPPHKKARMVENLRAVLSRRAFTTPEIHVVRGVISSLDRFSRRGQRAPAVPVADVEDANTDGQAGGE